MINIITRRRFIKRTAMALGAVSAAKYLPGAASAQTRHVVGDKLNCVQIGCGGRSMQHLDAVIGKNKQNLYAIVDPDERRWSAVETWIKKKSPGLPKPQAFTDYREMFDKIGKDIDAVFIAAPNHHHAPASRMAMHHDVNVYCEKPLCHTVAEARELRKMAKQFPKIATQMGNQGHCEDGYRSLCEFIWGDVIGKVTETHSWTDRSNGGVGPRPATEPVPKGLHWDTWVGPSPYRDFHSDLVPHEWHGWFDFGNGSIGNMGCHVLDGTFWALKAGHPTSMELEEVRGGTDERFPTGCRVRYDIPARGDMPAFKMYWYEGLNAKTAASADGVLRSAKGESRNLPPLLVELQKQYPDEQFDSSGTIYVGEKGIIYTGTYGDRMHLLPMEKMEALKKPAKTLPRPKDVFTDFITAVKEGRTDTFAPFEYGAQLTEFALLANFAVHAGLHNKVEWDGPGMKVTNVPAAEAWVSRPARDGWKV